MTLRRYAPMKPSRGTTIPSALRAEVRAADGGCVMGRMSQAQPCAGEIQLDHVRASGALGKKSATERGNLVSLCSAHHREKTLEGRAWRPLLIAYIEFRDR